MIEFHIIIISNPMQQLLFGLIVIVTHFGPCESKVATMAASANAVNRASNKPQFSYNTTENEKGMPLWGIM